ncbi:hypothetical protein DENSPDRAFT_883957 [Dentipellis sp. KUC8613]|nr:hypothetical protein DENSPDRAFT_883957 [Dentipellis sp. KUC8613]
MQPTQRHLALPQPVKIYPSVYSFVQVYECMGAPARRAAPRELSEQRKKALADDTSDWTGRTDVEGAPAFQYRDKNSTMTGLEAVSFDLEAVLAVLLSDSVVIWGG